MLACKKCGLRLEERLAQQSLCELEEALTASNSPIASRRKAMNAGPLCDDCLARWQEEHRPKPAASVRPEPIVVSSSKRTLAMEKLDAACRQLANDNKPPR